MQDSYKIPAKSRKIPQDLVGSCKILQEKGPFMQEKGPCMQEKGPFLVRSCKSVFTGFVQINTILPYIFHLIFYTQEGYEEREDRIAELEEFINDQVVEIDQTEARLKEVEKNCQVGGSITINSSGYIII